MSTAIIESKATFTRPANTTAYTSGDLVADSTTAGSVVPMAFDLGAQQHSQCFLRRVRVYSTDTSLTNAVYRVHLYKTRPTPVNGDNVAFSTNNYNNYIGACDVTMSQAFSDGSFGVGVPNYGYDINFVSSSENIYGLMEARGAKTPDSAEVFVVSLEVRMH